MSPTISFLYIAYHGFHRLGLLAVVTCPSLYSYTDRWGCYLRVNNARMICWGCWRARQPAAIKIQFHLVASLFFFFPPKRRNYNYNYILTYVTSSPSVSLEPKKSRIATLVDIFHSWTLSDLNSYMELVPCTIIKALLAQILSHLHDLCLNNRAALKL